MNPITITPLEVVLLGEAMCPVCNNRMILSQVNNICSRCEQDIKISKAVNKTIRIDRYVARKS